MVMREASNTLTPVVLELGGKDPFVLLPGEPALSMFSPQAYDRQPPVSHLVNAR